MTQGRLLVVAIVVLVARSAFAQPSPTAPPAPPPRAAGPTAAPQTAPPTPAPAPAPAPTPKPDPKRGAELFKAAQALGKDPSKLDQACDLYAESQTLAPSVATRLALADCREKQGRHYEAYIEFSGAAAEAVAAHDTKREKQANDRAAALVPKLVRVNVRVASPNAAGLAVAVGGRRLADAQWNQTTIAAPGPFVVDATAPGYQPFHVERATNAGEEVVIDVPPLVAVALPPPAPRPIAPVQPVAPTDQALKLKKARRMMIIGGVMFGVSCLMALHANSRYEDAVDELDLDDVDSAQLEADLATLVGLGGIVVAGIGYWKYRDAKQTHVMVTPTVTPTQAGVSVMGRF